LLDQTKNEGLFRVLMIHHPPVSDASRHKRLLDARVFMHALAQHGAELVLHGHDHLYMLNWLDGPDGTRLPAVGVPSASAAPDGRHEPAAYNLYRIDGAPGAWRCEAVSRGITPGGTMVEQKRMMLVGQG
jgi:3',5'-cyclic AMP phosphodiesterase CpdA